MATQYMIHSVSDFLAVPPERLSVCLDDFAVFLAMAIGHAEFETLVQEGMKMPAGSVRLRRDVFHWVDDGKPGLSAICFKGEDGAQIGRVDL